MKIKKVPIRFREKTKLIVGISVQLIYNKKVYKANEHLRVIVKVETSSHPVKNEGAAISPQCIDMWLDWLD